MSNFTLRPYQLEGSQFLQRQSAGLFFDVGLGKTITALHATKEGKHARTLILAPKSLLLQWKAEIDKFYPGSSVTLLTGTKGEKYKAWKSYKEGYLITNYETMRAYVEQLKPIIWDSIISDEATRLGNPKTKTYKALLMLPARFRWALTGTPISNSLLDAFGIFNWIKPDLLGKGTTTQKFWFFQLEYCVKNHFNAIVGFKNVDRLQKKIEPYYIRKSADQVAKDLPEKVITEIPIELSTAESKLYEQIKHEIYEELTGGKADKISLASLGSAIVQIVRLQQVTGHGALIGTEHTTSSKMEALNEKVEEIIEAGEKVIIFSKFAQMCKLIHKELAQYQPFLFIGETSSEDRGAIIDEFNKNAERKILICSTAGNEGLNLQVANHIINYDFDWSIAKQIQRQGRIHRIGQQKTVFIWNLVAKKTIDSYIMKKLLKKQKLAGELIVEDKDDLTVEDVRAILTE